MDFICVEKSLVIEIDGGIHQQNNVRERDENRTAELERMGLKVIRFTNDEVIHDINAVKQKIKAELLSPSPFGEGAGGEAGINIKILLKWAMEAELVTTAF